MATGEHDHGHDHGSGEAHDHPGMAEDVELSDRAKRLLAMEELLVEKGVIGRDDVRRVVDVSEARSPADGARVVAHAWADPDYRSRLLEDPTAALAELFAGANVAPDGPVTCFLQYRPYGVAWLVRRPCAARQRPSAAL